MNKIAIFVEGHTELIIVRELLLRYYEYSNIDIECRNLFTDNSLVKAEYDFPNENCDNHFQIINTGNDNAVLSRILKREKYMWNTGYTKIVGLRDMYSKNYREVSSQVIDEDVNQKFIDGATKTISQTAEKPNNIVMCFAIMEVEAWIIGVDGIFEAINSSLTNSFILEQLNLDLDNIDPEKEFYHPAAVINDIYGLIGLSYGKKKAEINSIAHKLTKENIGKLKESDKCMSFTRFINEIIN